MTPRPRTTGIPIRAIGYARVSTGKQADSGLSLESQNQKIRAMATVHDAEIVDVLVDAAESAATLDRPQVRELLRRVRAREVDAVYVAKLDRLTRSVRDLDELLSIFRKAGVALVSVSESLDTSTAAGRMVVNMLGVVSQWEREAIAERTRDALRAKQHRGERAGTIPYGWRLSADGKTLEQHPDEERLIRFAAEHRFELGCTWHDVAAALNRAGYRNRAGKPWTLHGVRSALVTRERHSATRT